jgi:endonuclease/exonuclease/phosphatase family metal-dependent hydrolase
MPNDRLPDPEARGALSMIATRVVDGFDRISLARRREILARAPAPELHAQLLAELPLFDRVEVGNPPGRPPPLGPSARVAFWNVERCKYLEESVALLARVGADVVLLAEMDLGMVRSGNRNTTREVAERLQSGHVFAAEFLELDLGDERERARHAGEDNAESLHGGAIVSAHVLGDPAVLRLDRDGAWFDGSNGERRVGGRIAVAARLPVAGVPVAFVAAHFESHGGPDSRAEEMRRLLSAVETYAAGAPVVIGGDFNTNSAPREVLDGPGGKAALEAETPGRLVNPVAYEPLFQVAAAAGYDWTGCNAPGPSQRTPPDGTPKPPHSRIDWFFCRGLQASDPQVVAAVGPDGQAISDHELLAVTVTPDTIP